MIFLTLNFYCIINIKNIIHLNNIDYTIAQYSNSVVTKKKKILFSNTNSNSDSQTCNIQINKLDSLKFITFS